MALKWCTELVNVKKRCSFIFESHPSNFKVTQDNKIDDFHPNWEFPDCNSSFNSRMDLKWCTNLDIVYKRCFIIFQGHLSNFKVTRDKKHLFDPNWKFPDCSSSLNSPMDVKWCTKLNVLQKRCPIVLQGHPSNFKAPQAEKSMIWIQFE